MNATHNKSQSPYWALMAEREKTIAEAWPHIAQKDGDGNIVIQYALIARTPSQHLIFSRTDKRWYIYNTKTGIWERQSDTLVVERLITLHEATVAKSNLSKEVNKQCLATQIAGKLKILTTNCYVSDDILNVKKERPNKYLVFKNGVIDLDQPDINGDARNFKLMPHGPEYLATFALPANFIPGAFSQKLTDFFDHLLAPEDQYLLQLWSGMLLAGSNLCQKIALVHGIGGTGKSLLVQMLLMFNGEQHVSGLRPDHVKSKFELSLSLGKTLLLASDVKPDFLRHAEIGHIKQLTGHDLLAGEAKNSGEPPVQKGAYNILITSNAPLTVNVQDDLKAWTRRLLIISTLDNDPKHVDDGLANDLKTNHADAMAFWMLQGYVALRRNQMLRQGPTIPLTQIQKDRIGKACGVDSDLEQFFKTGLVYGPTLSLSSADAHKAFKRSYPQSTYRVTTFKQQLKKRLLGTGNVRYDNNIVCGGKKIRGYYGVALKPAGPAGTVGVAQAPNTGSEASGGSPMGNPAGNPSQVEVQSHVP